MNRNHILIALISLALIALLIMLDTEPQRKKTRPQEDSDYSSAAQIKSQPKQSNSALVSSNRQKKSPLNYQDKQSLQLAISQFQRQGPKLDFIQRQNKAASLFRAAKKSNNYLFAELESLELQLSSVVYHDDGETLQAVMAAIRQRHQQNSPYAQDNHKADAEQLKASENQSQE